MGIWRKVRSAGLLAVTTIGLAAGTVNLVEWNAQRYIEKRLAYYPEQRTADTISEQRFLRHSFEDLQLTGYTLGLLSATTIFSLASYLSHRKQNIPSRMRKEAEQLIKKADEIELVHLVEEEMNS